MMCRALAFLALFLSAVSLPDVSHARPSERERVQQVNNDAIEAFKAGRLEEAVEMFTEVAESGVPVVPLARTWRNVGRCYEDLGQYEEALEAFEKAELHAKDPVRRNELGELIKRMRLLIHGGLDVRCEPDGVTLELVDSGGSLVRQGACPVVWQTLSRGRYFLDAHLPAEPPGPGRAWIADPLRRATVQVRGKSTEISNITFAGSLSVDAPPGSRVFVDDSPASVPVMLESGGHLIRIEAPRRTPWTTRIFVHPGEALTVRLPDASVTETPEPVPQDNLAPWLIGGGALLVGATSGALAAVQVQRASEAQRIYDERYAGYQPNRDDVQRAREDVIRLTDEARTAEIGAWVTGGIALSLATVSALMFLAEDDATAEVSWHAGPGGLVWTW